MKCQFNHYSCGGFFCLIFLLISKALQNRFFKYKHKHNWKTQKLDFTHVILLFYVSRFSCPDWLILWRVNIVGQRPTLHASRSKVSAPIFVCGELQLI